MQITPYPEAFKVNGIINKVRGFCCPVPLEPRFPSYTRQRVLLHYRSHLHFGPITAVPCRAKAEPLLRTSILVRPHIMSVSVQKLIILLNFLPIKMVEAQGTDHGSATTISRGAYRHSRRKSINKGIIDLIVASSKRHFSINQCQPNLVGH